MKEALQRLHFFSALRYSAQGLMFMFREKSFRQELVLLVVHFIVLGVIRPEMIWWVVLTMGMMLILIVEILNTAIEAIVDKISPERHLLAGKAKDCGSAAVGLSIFLYFFLWGVFGFAIYWK